MRILSLLLLSGLLTSCAVDSPYGQDPGLSESAIVDGSLEAGYSEVMFLYNLSQGSACTATLIAPRVMLTAKHCVQNGDSNSASPASSFRLFTGQNANRPGRQYNVSEVRVAPGRWDLRDASDVAILILSSAAEEEPRQVSFDSPSALTGQRFTAIGYGQTPSGGSGTKYRTEKTVDGFARGFIYVRPSVCSGDSGGPLIREDGRIMGVASYIYSETGGQPRCGSAPGAYNAISAYRAMIEGAIEDSGGCVPAEEICDNVDNNCDGVVDEGCIAIGETCFREDQCASGDCEELEGGRVCTQSCDPLRPGLGCPSGMFCEKTTGCEGFCAPTTRLSLSLGEECAVSGDCLSGYCAAVGEPTERCHPACGHGLGMCLAGEVCFALPGSCGACVGAEYVGSPRTLGEPCLDNNECEEGSCLEDSGVQYCSRACTGDGSCGDDFHCREMMCVRGVREDVGGGCVTNEDCGSGLFCAQRGESAWCTTVCEPSASDCPSGYSCVSVGDVSICAPEGGLAGDTCVGNEDCISGLCATASAGPVCSSLCGAGIGCSPGFECVRLDDVGLCLRPPAPPMEDAPDEGGCSVGGDSAPVGMMWLAGLALVWVRRRVR